MFTEVKEYNIQNVAVDVRNNGGGNSLVCNALYRYLDVDSYKVVGCKWRMGPLLLNLEGGVVTNDKHNDLLFCGAFYHAEFPLVHAGILKKMDACGPKHQ